MTWATEKGRKMQLDIKDKEEHPIWEVIALFLLVGVIISSLFWYLFEIGLVSSFLSGFFLWGIIYFFFLFKHFWIIPEGNYGVVLQNYLQPSLSKKPGDERHIDSIEIPAGQRSCSTGIGAKWPWEVAVGEPIHLVKAMPLGGSITALDSRNEKFVVKWQASLTPVPGRFLPRYLLVEDAAAKSFFEGRFEAFIETEFKKLVGTEVMADMKGFADKFKNCFNGPNIISDDERTQGRFTNAPLIELVEMEEKAQKASQLRIIIDQNKTAIDALIASGVSPNNATAAVLALQGIDGVEFSSINVTGIEGATGDIILGGISTKTGKKSNGKK